MASELNPFIINKKKNNKTKTKGSGHEDRKNNPSMAVMIGVRLGFGVMLEVHTGVIEKEWLKSKIKKKKKKRGGCF